MSNIQKKNAGRFEDFFRFNVSDVILILVILSATIGAVIYKKNDATGTLAKPSEATVFLSGDIIRKLSLDKDQDIILSNGDIIIEIRDNKIRVKKSSCPRQTCVHMGWIQHPGETIACIPHKLLIEINRTDSQVVDAVIY